MKEAEIGNLLDRLYLGRMRLAQAEIRRAAVAADLSAEAIALLDELPEGEYAEDEAAEAVHQLDREHSALRADAAATTMLDPGEGVPGDRLSDDQLFRELGTVHRTRADTLQHGSDSALTRHSSRTEELEQEYLRRFPDRTVDPGRMRNGARARSHPDNDPQKGTADTSR